MKSFWRTGVVSVWYHTYGSWPGWYQPKSIYSMINPQLTRDHINVAISNAFCKKKKRNCRKHIRYRKGKRKRQQTNFIWLKVQQQRKNLRITWNDMNCISHNSISGFLNQKRSSRGFKWVPTGPTASTTSRASCATTCWSSVPTSMTNFSKFLREKKVIRNVTNHENVN